MGLQLQLHLAPLDHWVLLDLLLLDLPDLRDLLVPLAAVAPPAALLAVVVGLDCRLPLLHYHLQWLLARSDSVTWPPRRYSLLETVVLILLVLTMLGYQ